MKNIILSSLFSFFLHGIVLACCIAVPAQTIVPIFQGGNSALTLTSLSISAPAAETIPVDRHPGKHEPDMSSESDLMDDVPAEPEEEAAPEETPDDFPILPAREPAVAASPGTPDPKTHVDADARAKGVSGLLADSAGIHPFYPLGARLRGEEGVVKVKVCVGSNGKVMDCAVAKSSGYSALDDAALKAVKYAHFTSAKSYPLQTENKTVLTIRFDLVD